MPLTHSTYIPQQQPDIENQVKALLREVDHASNMDKIDHRLLELKIKMIRLFEHNAQQMGGMNTKLLELQHAHYRFRVCNSVLGIVLFIIIYVKVYT